jgi:transcriptional/translational regulatory protein YebC/TACO1
MEPSSVVEVDGEAEARSLVKLMEALDDHDDVEAVHANFDIPESVLEQAAA